MSIIIKKNGHANEEPKIPEDQRPPIVYHYCSLDALINIIKSKVIWLSDSYSVNDYMENTWIISFINDKIISLRDKDSAAFLEKIIATYNLNKTTPYVSCYSTSGDVLSQWRAYADDGKGVALGININSPGFKFYLPVTAAIPKLTIGIHPVVYNPEQQAQLVGTIFDKCLSDYKSNVVDFDNSVLNCAIGLKRLTPVIKNPAFAEEKEWRIIHTPLILGDQEDNTELLGNVSNIHFKNSSGKLLSYFELPLSKFDKEKPIAEIVTGPKCEIDHSSLNMFLSVHGYRKVKIWKSNASYR